MYAASHHREVNQDRPFILHPTSIGSDEGDGGSFVMGIMDGHGTHGHLVAHLVLTELIQKIMVDPNSPFLDPYSYPYAPAKSRIHPEDPKVERWWVELYREMDQKIPPSIADDGGCTASVIAKFNSNDVIVANTGDSQTFIAAYRKPTRSVSGTQIMKENLPLNVTILYRSKPHKAHEPEELSRIEAAGGFVELPQVLFGEKMSSRVQVPVVMDNMHTTAIMSLAMSRSFGDAMAKKVGVIVDPTVELLHMEDLRKEYRDRIGNHTSDSRMHDRIQLFAVSVSDGLFDEVSMEDIAQHLALGLEGGAHGNSSLYQACEELIMKSSKAWWDKSNMFGQSYRDDISIAVHEL